MEDMQLRQLSHDLATLLPTGQPGLRVAPDWPQQLARAEEMCRLVDRHLDFEARDRHLVDLDQFLPEHLCPEQRVQLTSDLYVASHSPGPRG